MVKANPGDRVKITGAMPNEPDPIPVGTVGVVTDVLNAGTRFEQYVVDWDTGRSLMLVPDDPFDVVDEPENRGGAPTEEGKADSGG